MKFKKFIPILLILISTFLLAGCSKNENNGETLKYSTQIVENVLESINTLDYDSFKENVGPNMNELVKSKETFISLMMPIKNSIGEYQKGSLKFIDSMKRKDYISLLYEADFSSENEPVKISATFKEDDPSHKIQELYLNSPKVKELMQNNKTSSSN